MKVPLLHTPASTDPVRIQSVEEWRLARQIHETLYRLGPEGPVPALAMDLPQRSKDGREWLIRLRPGLTFHEGGAVDADALIASWQRLLDKQTGSAHWWLLAPVEGAVDYRSGKRTHISGLERVNDLTLRMRLSVPVQSFSEAMGSLPTAILPRRPKIQAAGHLEGCGPFRLEEVSEQGLKLSPFVQHWRGRPFIDALDHVVYASRREASLAFELGQVQLGLDPPGRSAGSGPMDGPIHHRVYLVLNSARMETMPAGFRTAIEQAIDRKALVEYLVGERGVATDEIIEAGTTGDHSIRAAQPGRAETYVKQLYLEHMGVAPVFDFIVHAGDAFEKSIAERIQLDLKDVGLSVFVVPLEHEQYDRRLRAGDFDFHLARPLPLVEEPELQLLQVMAHVGGEEAVRDYLQSLASLPMDSSRAGIIRERARVVQVRTPWIPLFVHGWRVHVKDGLRGFQTAPDGVVDWGDVWSGG
ncbi:MAG: ABC transporter substrate-binding protein [Deltaproteobacteria bacterium]|nr:ABC transporter substrate-binding protein [Deltaproteobacteria bacterium]